MNALEGVLDAALAKLPWSVRWVAWRVSQLALEHAALWRP